MHYRKIISVLIVSATVCGTAYWYYNGATSSPETLAQAATMARTNPLLGIEGTDPDALIQATDSLENVMNRIAEVQKTPDDARAIGSLYPIHFLRALAELETARQLFIASPTAAHMRRYDEQLSATVRMGYGDEKAFALALQAFLPLKPVRLTGPAGTISTDTIRVSLADIDAAFLRAQTKEVSLVAPAFDSREGVFPRTVPASVLSVGSVWQDVFAPSGQVEHFLISLESSACIGAGTGPYFFGIIGESADKLHGPTIRSLSDIMVTPTAGSQGPVLIYAHEKLGITYMPANQLNFYECPTVSTDLGTLAAIQAIVQFAINTPGLVPTERLQLLKTPDVYFEQDALLYLSAAQRALASDTSPESGERRAELDRLRLMVDERSAHLEFLVENIATVLSNDLSLLQSGVPFDLSARTLFLSHSAFPSLFLSQNRSFMSEPSEIFERSATNTDSGASHFVSYLELQKTVPRATIVHDIRMFLQMEGKTSDTP